MFLPCPRYLNWLAISVLAVLATASPAKAQGLVLPALGPVNRSMAGASVAAPLDAIGAIHWNPAAISGLPTSQMDFGAELLYAPTELSSTVRANAFGPGIPPISLSGSTDSESGAFLLPAFSLVYRPEDSCCTYGVGLFTVGGFGVNYPGDNTNPILSAPPPNGLGLGPLFSRLQVIQLAPTIAVQLTDHVAVGFAPTVTVAELMVDPAVFAAPNLNGFPTSPTATHSRLQWGLGFQTGIYYTSEAGWNFGASIKSPQWLETFRFRALDGLRRPRTIRFDADYPMIVSLGAAYTGFDRLVLAADLRYIDFRNTDGFRTAGFDSSGAVTGLGWDSVFSVHLGVQYQLTGALSVRLGYSYNQNPIDDAVSAFNVASPPIYQHVFASGASYQISDALKVSLAYVHAFENSITGPFVSPLGPVPGTTVRTKLSADALVLGASVQF